MPESTLVTFILGANADYERVQNTFNWLDGLLEGPFMKSRGLAHHILQQLWQHVDSERNHRLISQDYGKLSIEAYKALTVQSTCLQGMCRLVSRPFLPQQPQENKNENLS